MGLILLGSRDTSTEAVKRFKTFDKEIVVVSTTIRVNFGGSYVVNQNVWVVPTN